MATASTEGEPKPPVYNDPPPPYPGGPIPEGFNKGYQQPMSQETRMAQTYSYPQPTGTTVVMAQQPTTTTTLVVRGGNCPNCQVGYLVDEFSCCGVCLGVFLFPFGLICCLLMRQMRCTNCGKEF